MTDTIRPTRFPELGYTQIDKNCWRIAVRNENMCIGPYYCTKAELLADLGRFATDYGIVT